MADIGKMGLNTSHTRSLEWCGSTIYNLVRSGVEIMGKTDE